MGTSGSNPCPAAHREKQSHRLSYMRLVEGLLGAAASLETSEDLNGRERTGGDPHKDEVGGYENHFCRLDGPELLNDFVEQREWRKHVH